MQEMVAEQRRQTREIAVILNHQAPTRQHSKGTFTMLEAAEEAMPDNSPVLVDFLQNSGKMVEGSFHNM